MINLPSSAALITWICHAISCSCIPMHSLFKETAVTRDPNQVSRDTGSEPSQPKPHELAVGGIGSKWRRLWGRLRFLGLWSRVFGSHPCHCTLWCTIPACR
jgi:hypothetical protein